MEVNDVRTMRLNTALGAILTSALAAAILAAPAGAAVPHVVQPGETLWTIAAANNLTTRTVAAYNGLSEDSQVVLGSTINVPTTVDRKSTRLNSSHANISYAVFCLKKKKKITHRLHHTYQ